MKVRRGKVDAGGSMVAGMATAAVFALVKRTGRGQTWRYLRVGMGLGLVSGIMQDLMRWSQGATPWYVESIWGKIKLKEKIESTDRKV